MANESQDVYLGTADDIKSCDIEKPLADAESPSCDYYDSAYSRACQDAEKNGNKSAHVVYRFLRVMCGFRPSYGNREALYQPMFTMTDGRRGLIPSDLSERDVEHVRLLFEKSKDQTLRARLGDVVWITAKDYKAAAIAAECFVQSGERLLAPDEYWTQAMPEFTRALQLALLLGKEKDLFKKVLARVQELALAIDPTEKSFKACQLMNILCDCGAADAERFVGVAAAHAKAMGDSHYKARSYWELEARWCRAAKRADAEQSAKLNAAETLILDAEARVAGNDPSYMAGARFLAEGIEALRQAGAEPSRIERLKKQLVEWQKRSMAEMKSFTTEIPIGDAVASAAEHVRGRPFDEAVARFALGQSIVKPEKLRERVLQGIKDHPMAYIAGATYLDEGGRVKGSRGALVNPEDPDFEASLEMEMFHYAASHIWGLRAAIYIEPARQQIWNEHHPRLSDIMYLAHGHPFIPPGREMIFARGLWAGFDGDFLLASHLLVPQIENSVRRMLAMNGVDVTNLMSDLTQPLKLSAKVLCHEKTTELLGKDMAFELRGHLIEKTGFEFRHQLAHGLLSDDECCTAPAVSIWWLVLRLCVIGYYNYAKPGEKVPPKPDEKKET